MNYVHIVQNQVHLATFLRGEEVAARRFAFAIQHPLFGIPVMFHSRSREFDGAR